ncbi:MAG: TonB-dependent receptor, partial [Pedobacter sp.]
MKKIILSVLALFITTLTFAQNTWKAKIADTESKTPLTEAYALLKGTNINAKADEKGIITLSNIPNGPQTIIIKLVGYEQKDISLTFPLTQTEPQEVLLEATEDELEGITISSTRSSRSIQDIATRVEFIAGEELEEKANMKPGDIRMMLSESTGIQTQQTSATSANAAIRIQGLDGRYTQILKDGFPLYAGASSGLG